MINSKSKYPSDRIIIPNHQEVNYLFTTSKHKCQPNCINNLKYNDLRVHSNFSLFGKLIKGISF